MVRHNLPFADLSYGFIGHLTYIPSPDPSQYPGRFHTTRRLQDKPAFCVLQPTKTWLSAERQPPQEPTGDDLDFERAPWKRVKTHRNWLYFKEPEVYAGVGESVQPLLVEGENLYMRDETSLPRTVTAVPLLALGNLSTPGRSKNRHRSVHLLATAAGATGETLRLTRTRELQMGWGDGTGENLILHHVDLDDPEDHMTWTGDAQPISKIKFGTNHVGDDRIRRLLVQKPHSTTIFRPEYRVVPATSNINSASIRPAPPSRIVVDEIAKITLDMTGGNNHSDVAFNGGYRGCPQQIAIVDERGYWSIWDAVRVRHNAKVRATVGYRCFGHINAGVLDELPSSTEYAARPHGILFVGYAHQEEEDVNVDSDDEWEDDAEDYQRGGEQDESNKQSSKQDPASLPSSGKASKGELTLRENSEEEERDSLSESRQQRRSRQSRAARGATAAGMRQRQKMSGRSDTLLVWNESAMSIVDVPDGLLWPKPDIVSTHEKILDVQYSPRSKRHILILTTHHIIWLDLFPPGLNKKSEQRGASILVKSPHNIDAGDTPLHLTACRERYPFEDECIVTLIYSTQSRHATMYWFWQEKSMGLPQFHRQILLESIDFGDKAATPVFQTLALVPCRVTPNGMQPASEGSANYVRHGVRFYQLLTLGKDLSVHSTVCASLIPSPKIREILPPDAVITQKRGGMSMRTQKWKQYLKYLGNAFVVPDDWGDVERTLLAGRNQIETWRPGVLDGRAHDHPEGRPVILKFKYLGQVLEQDLEAAVADARPVLISVLFKAISHRLQEARDSGSLIGLTSLLDLVGGSDLVVKHDFDLSCWNDEIERLYDMAAREGDVTIVRKGSVFRTGLREDRVDVKTLYRQICEVWLGSLRDDTPDAARSQRERLVRRMAVIIALSSYGVMVGPTSLRPARGPGPGETQASQSDIAHPDEGRPSSSRSRSRSLSQSRKAVKAEEANRLKDKASGALARLRALAGLPRAEEPGPNALPQHPVLALWPETPGVPVSEYISSVKQASGATSDAIRGTRERRARRDAKKERLRQRYGSQASSMVSSQVSGTDWETEPETTQGELRNKNNNNNNMGLLPLRGRVDDDMAESLDNIRTGQPPSRPVIASSQPRPRTRPGIISSQPQPSTVGGQAEGQLGAFDEASEAQGSWQSSRPVTMSQPVSGAFGSRPKAIAKKAKKGAAKIRGFR